MLQFTGSETVLQFHLILNRKTNAYTNPSREKREHCLVIPPSRHSCSTLPTPHILTIFWENIFFPFCLLHSSSKQFKVLHTENKHTTVCPHFDTSWLTRL